MLAREFGVTVQGVDASPANCVLAGGAARSAGLADRAAFCAGDAAALPFPDGQFDAVICECAFCTFPDKPAAAEFARVLRPGGRVGITDATASPAALPDELTTLAARIACTADTRPVAGYVDMLTTAGLTMRLTERHDGAILRLIDQIEARLTLVRMTARTKAEALGLDIAQVSSVLAAAREAVSAGLVGYACWSRRSRAEPGPPATSGWS